MLTRLLLLLTLWLPIPVASAGPRDSGSGAPEEIDASTERAARAVFDQAMQRLGVGEVSQAAKELAELADRFPTSTLAPEALFVAAQQYEEALAQPVQAQTLYRRLVLGYPDSRLLRRAESRLAQLTLSLQTGAEPLLRFQAIVRATSESSPERTQQLTALLAAHPQFALGDQATYLLLDGALRRGEVAAAVRYQRELATRFPSSEWSARGQQSYAEWLLRRGQLWAARAEFAILAGHPSPLWRQAAVEGLREVSSAQRRRLIAVVVGAVLLLTMLGIGLRHRQRLWPPPEEVAYYTPVGLFFVLVAALTQGAVFARPLLWLLLGGVVLCWLSAAAARAPARLRPIDKLWGGLWRATLALLLCYLAIERQGLWELLLETLRNGPDR
jgi:outer membrane protein assembly factor BamD (BamD/ComL family)